MDANRRMAARIAGATRPRRGLRIASSARRRTAPRRPRRPAGRSACGSPTRAPLLDPLNRGRLLRGLGLTLGLSLVAVVGSLGVGVALAWADQSLGTSPATRALRLPLRGLTAVARMTPPILQLYILFFGLGGLLASHTGFTPGGFLVAGVVLSLYAGATNAILLRAALEHVRREHPGTPTHRLIPAAVDRCYEGLTATLVNIVKAAGLASTIALPGDSSPRRTPSWPRERRPAPS